jgi:hypothetical protein
MPELESLGLAKAIPLWYYLLREAEVRGKGETLGPVGARIVAEVFIGLLEGDALSYRRADPDWKPTLGKDGTFGMVDLLRFAQVTTLV